MAKATNQGKLELSGTKISPMARKSPRRQRAFRQVDRAPMTDPHATNQRDEVVGRIFAKRQHERSVCACITFMGN